MKKILFSLMLSLSVFLFGLDAYAVKYLDMEVYNADEYESPGTHRIYDVFTGEYVKTNSLVQVIWAGPNGQVDMINLTNFMPGGDDQLLQFDFQYDPISGDLLSTSDAIAHIGDGYVDDGDGRLIAAFQAIDLEYYDKPVYDGLGNKIYSGGVAENIKVYVRVFNMEDPYQNLLDSFDLGPISWFDSPVVGLPEPDFFYFGYYNFLVYDGQQLGPQYTQKDIWDQYFVPEPSSLLLLLSAFAGLKVIRRKK